jgi:hypothetical protein
MSNEELGGFKRNNSFGVGHEPPPPPNYYDDWYYVEKGEKKGPISAVEIKCLLNNGQIVDDTHVWRSSMKDWTTIRDSELYVFVENTPPAIPTTIIGNGYVWVMAFFPLILGLIDASIAAHNRLENFKTFYGIKPNLISPGITFKVFASVAGLFAMFDFLRLKRAGYGNLKLGLLSFFLPVFYLFMRAKLLKQKPYYAITWIVMLILGILIDSD